MKVICINDQGWCNDQGCTTGPLYNEICEVEGVFHCLIDGPSFYLAGYNEIDFDGNRENFVMYLFRGLNDDELAQESLVEQANEIINEPVFI